MTDDKLKPTQADRERAWPFRPEPYVCGDKGPWMAGNYDHVPVIRAMAAHRIAATDAHVSKHSELATCLYQAAYVMKSEASKQTDETYKSAMMKCEHNIRLAAKILTEAPDAQVEVGS